MNGKSQRILRLALMVLCGALFASPALAQGQVVEYYHLDALGTVRAVTEGSGTVLERHDYLPFGEELCPFEGTYVVCGTAPPGQAKRFTGKERDTETGLDYFGARYYASKVGRFTTIDPVYTWQENLVDPQRWNRYAYGRNNPQRYVDPDGKWIETVWDLANVGFGVASFRSNIKGGNWGSALLDGLGLGYDAAAAMVPILPGGAGAAIKAARSADRARDLLRGVDKVADAAKVGEVSAGTIKGLGNIGSHGPIDAGKALEAGQKWLGEYSEIAPGVFRSSDGLRQFRMTSADIKGAHGTIGSHVHFEALNDLGRVVENLHLPVTR